MDECLGRLWIGLSASGRADLLFPFYLILTVNNFLLAITYFMLFNKCSFNVVYLFYSFSMQNNLILRVNLGIPDKSYG